MALNNLFLVTCKFKKFSTITRSFTVGKIIYHKSPAATTVPKVIGLSEACLRVPKDPVGPGAAKNTGYKNPEYFCYDKTSYFEAEIEMLKYRCPQPSVNKPYCPTAK